ncbi:MAG: hypothetical protein IKQ14_02515, partial [Candidatus Methanomethylophilaceae archaeon]|nr:hypothetical protein [Candidatus Methanomethylophilaceae archaeon]
KSENKIINKLKIEKNEINFISNKKKFKDGLYEGIIINGKREIKGIMKYRNGSIYEGQWKNDKRHGRGLYATQNYNNPNIKGILYEGEFNNDKIEGYGIGKYSSGDQYEGEWKNDQQYGRGNSSRQVLRAARIAQHTSLILRDCIQRTQVWMSCSCRG